MIKNGPGILCPKCGSPHLEVVDSRPGPDYVRRRRKCRICPEGPRLTTLETVLPDNGDTGALEALRLQQRIMALTEVRRHLIQALIREFTS